MVLNYYQSNRGIAAFEKLFLFSVLARVVKIGNVVSLSMWEHRAVSFVLRFGSIGELFDELVVVILN